MRTNYMKAKIDYTQQNSKYRLCGDRDETKMHLINKWSQQTQTRHEKAGKVINKELCNKLKFDRSTKFYVQKPEYVHESKT